MKLPLHALLLKLQREGLDLSPAEQLKVQEVLHKLGSKYLDKPEKLAQILSPAIVKSKEEQSIFEQVFHRYWLEINQAPEIEVADELILPDKKELQEKINQKRKWMYPIAALAFLAALVSIAGIPFTLQQKISQTSPVYGELIDAPFSNSISQAEQEAFDKEIIYGSQANKLLASDSEELTFSPGHGPRHVIAGERFNFLLEANKNLENLSVNWDFGDGNSSEEVKPMHTYAEPGIYTVFVKVADQLESLTFPVYPAGTSYTSFAASELAQQQSTQSRIKWQVFLLAFFLILAIEGYLEKFKQKQYRLAFQQYFHKGENAPYTLPYPDVQEKLRAEPGMYALAEKLKKRRVSEVLGLDIKSSLYETVQSGGFPQLIYTPEKSSSEYLVLIDESGPSDQQAMLFEQFVALLKKEEVLIQSFRFRNDPRVCYNEDYPEGIELDLISRRIRADRMLIFSKGSFFLDLRTHQLADWIETSFAPWPQKVILTPEPKRTWGFRERALQQEFQVLAADLQSQQEIVEALLSENIEDFESLREEALVSTYAEAPLQEYDFNKKEDLQDYLGDALYKWLMATMVSTEHSWAMTMKIGQALEEETEIVLEGNKLVSYDNLLKLSRIPWLQSEEVPAGLRKEFLQELNEETEAIARRAVLDLLAEINPPKDSAAYQQKRIAQSIQEAALYPEDHSLQEKLRFLWQNNMLSQSMRGVLKKDFRPKFIDFLYRYERAFTPAFLGTLFLAVSTFVGVNVNSFSDEALVDKYFEEFPSKNILHDYTGQEIVATDDELLALESLLIECSLSFENFERDMGIEDPKILLELEKKAGLYNVISLELGFEFLKIQAYQLATEAFEVINFNGFDVELKQWYLALANTGLGEDEKALQLLTEIQKDPNNLYYFKAKALEEDLNSFWRF